MTRDQLRSLWLNRAVADKLVSDPAAVIAIGRRNLAKLRQVHTQGPVVESFDKWEKLLDGPVASIVAVLTSEADDAIQLRQNSPFAGVLSPAERADVLSAFARSTGVTTAR